MGLLDGILGGASIAAGLSNADSLSAYGNQIAGQLKALGGEVANNSKFQGYGVSSALGNTSVNPNGSVSLGAGPNQGMIGQADNYFNSSQALMNQSMMAPAARQNQIYGQIMAAQNPELDRMQAAQQAREYAMGRGGVRGSLYGGTAEDAAMARARVDGSNQAMLAAMDQARAEQAQQADMATAYGQLGQSQYQTSYLPMELQMKLLQIAGADADRAQTGQLTGQGYYSQLGLGGIEAAVNAKKAASEMKASIFDSILDNAGGLFSGIIPGVE